MYNWSVDTARLKKNTEKFNIYKLEQAINFGLNGSRLSIGKLRKNFNNLKIDPHKKDYLAALLRQKQLTKHGKNN